MSHGTSTAKPNWRLGALIGLLIGLSLCVSKVVEKALTPQLGEWGAFGVALLAVVVVAGVLGLIAQAVVRK